MKALLFAGAAEGRKLAERLAESAIDMTISVATDYGRETLAGLDGRFPILVGRLDREAMLRLLKEYDFELVVDATHPYATQASDAIQGACADAGVPRIRLGRAASVAPGCEFYPSTSAAAARLSGLEGNVLVATGLKELAVFTSVPRYAERIHVRVLPSSEAVARCEELGFKHGRIIAMQGPFSREVNRAIMRHFGIAVLVTKDGGEAGGFGDKIAAAEDVGARVLVVGRPPGETGLPLDAVHRRVLDMLEGKA